MTFASKMKKKSIIALSVLAMLVFGACCEIQFVLNEGQQLLAWRVLAPWSKHTVSNDKTRQWFIAQAGTNSLISVCDARCYGLLGRGSALFLPKVGWRSEQSHAEPTSEPARGAAPEEPDA